MSSLMLLHICATFILQCLGHNCNTICITKHDARCNAMKKFRIPSIPPTTNKSIRFPNDVIEEIEAAIKGTDCTFSAFVVEAVRVALENLKEESE